MKKYLLLLTTFLLFALSGYSFTQIVTVKNYAFAPSGFTINIGDTVKFVWASGTHTTTSVTIPSGAATWDHAISSASTSFIYVPSKTGTYNYKCVFHAALGMVASFTVVCPNVSVQISAASATTFCKGGSVVLKSTASSSVTSYQWKNNGTNILNATKASYTAKSSGTYTLTAKNNCGKKATSNSIVVTVNPLPTATITPSGTVSICAGDSIKLNANIGSNNSYKWKRNGIIIPNATSATYFAKTAGNYRVIVTKTTTGCSKTSAATTVTTDCLNAVAAKPQENKIEIFPNPSANDFHLIIPAFAGNQYLLSVFDVEGKLMGEKKITSGDFSFGSELKQGIYFAEIKRGDAVLVREKIIKQ
jgi:plastocyanin